MTIAAQVKKIADDARQAAIAMARLPSGRKNDLLVAMADALVAGTAEIIAENGKDLEAGKQKGLSDAMLDRLMLDASRVTAMADGLREVATLPDPVGEVTKMWLRPNGLQVGKMRIPLGVIGIIYEARPNVTADAAALCLKAGNAVVLRGGSEAIECNRALAAHLGRRFELAHRLLNPHPEQLIGELTPSNAQLLDLRGSPRDGKALGLSVRSDDGDGERRRCLGGARSLRCSRRLHKTSTGRDAPRLQRIR